MDIQYRAFYGPADWGWVIQRERIRRVEDTRGIMAIDMSKGENGETVAAIIFDSFTDNSVQAHIIVDKPMVLRHGFLEEGFRYIFETCDFEVIYGIVKSDNKKAQKLDTHIGFKEVYRMKDGFSKGIDLIFYEIRRDECRFYKPVKEAVNE